MKRKGIAYQRMFLAFLIVFSLPLCLAIVFYFYNGYGQANGALK